MVGLKCLFLVSLVASALAVTNTDPDTLRALLRRMLVDLREQKVAKAQDYVTRLMAKSQYQGKPTLERVSVLDMTSGELLASGGEGEVPLTIMEKERIASAVKSQRYQTFEDRLLTADGKKYRLHMSTITQPVVVFGGRGDSSIFLKKTDAGAVVARAPDTTMKKVSAASFP